MKKMAIKEKDLHKVSGGGLRETLKKIFNPDDPKLPGMIPMVPRDRFRGQ